MEGERISISPIEQRHNIDMTELMGHEPRVLWEGCATSLPITDLDERLQVTPSVAEAAIAKERAIIEQGNKVHNSTLYVVSRLEIQDETPKLELKECSYFEYVASITIPGEPVIPAGVLTGLVITSDGYIVIGERAPQGNVVANKPQLGLMGGVYSKDELTQTLKHEVGDENYQQLVGQHDRRSPFVGMSAEVLEELGVLPRDVYLIAITGNPIVAANKSDANRPTFYFTSVLPCTFEELETKYWPNASHKDEHSKLIKVRNEPWEIIEALKGKDLTPVTRSGLILYLQRFHGPELPAEYRV